MKIKLGNKTIFIADDSPNAKKIALGFDFDVDADNQITVYSTKNRVGNKYQLTNRIKTANSVADIKAILLKLVDLLDNDV